MIERNDVIDALKVLGCYAADKTPNADEGVIKAWLEYTSHYPPWTGDELVAAAHELNKSPRERMVQPADLGAIVRSYRSDRLSRMRPDDRARAVPAPDVRRDEFGYIDKSAPDHYVPPPSPAPRRSAGQEDARRAFAEAKGKAAPDVSIPGLNVKAVRCVFCRAPVGEPCTMPGMPGKPREALKKIAGHPSRIVAAALAQGISPEEADRLSNNALAGQVSAVRRAWNEKDDTANAVRTNVGPNAR